MNKKSSLIVTIRHLTSFLAILFVPAFAKATVFGPYTPDASTVYLFHFNEPAGSYVATNAAGSAAAGTNAVAYSTITGNTFPGAGVSAPANFAVLGASSASGFNFGSFGSAANLANSSGGTNGLGVDANQNGGFSLSNTGGASNDVQVSHASIVGANNAFTLEALINVASTNGNQEIICTDNGGANNVRGFQFRLTGPLLEFFDIGLGSGAVSANDLKAPIPTDAVNGFVANQWYHVAVTHVENPVPGGTNTVFYWTALNDSAVLANPVFTNSGVAFDPSDPMILDIGNEGRSAGSSLGSSEGLQGLIDEVRISKVARAANQMMFYSPVITFTMQPTSQTVATNQTASFTAVAAGTGTITYQWYSTNVSGITALANQTNTTLSIAAGPAAGVSNYIAVASNGGISTPATSQVATLTIRLPNDLRWDPTTADWDTSTANWTADNGATTTTYTELDNVAFDILGIGQPSVNLTSDRTPNAVTVDTSAGDYTIGGSGTIMGSGVLTKNSDGKLTLTTSNSFSGGTTINAGIVELDSFGQIGTGPIVNNGSIVVNSSGAADFPSTISGSGNFTNLSGNSSIDVSNSYSGASMIAAGTVFARNGWSFGSAANGTTVTSPGQIYFTANVDFPAENFTIDGAGDGNGALRKGGAGATAIFGTINMASDSTIGVDTGATLTLSNTLSGTAALTKNGGGTLVLATANTYNGKTTVSAGTLSISQPNSLGVAPGSFTPDQITLSGSTLSDSFGNVTLTDGLRGITVNDTAGLTVVNTNSIFTISNSISGIGPTITKSGPGVLVLNGDNSTTLSSATLNTDTSQAGTPGVNDGITRIAAPNAAAGITTIAIRNNNAGFSTLQLDGSNGALDLTPNVTLNGRNNFVPAIENVSGNNTLAPGLFTWGVGGTFYPFQSDAGTLTIGSSGSSFPNVAPNGFRTTIFSGSGDIVVAAVIQDSLVATLTNTVLKTGTGTLTLQAANTYQGPTIISNGVFRVDGSIGVANGGAVTNFAGALGGTGTINTAVYIMPGASLAPGDSVGTLTINGDLNIAGNLAIELNKSLSPSNDLVAVSGVLTNSGTGSVIVSNLGPALAVGDTFYLFNKPLTNGAAMAVTGGGVVWNNNLAADGSISVASLTIPQPAINSVTLSGSNLIFSGTNGPANGSFRVLATTNLALPVAQWTALLTNNFNASGQFSVTNSVTAAPQRFYLLQVQ
jgi:autotransporter-associated beta strand protein